MDSYDVNNLPQSHKRRSANEGYHYMVANDTGGKMQLQVPSQPHYLPNQQYFLTQHQYVQYHSPFVRPKITKIPVIAGGRKKTFSRRSKTGCLTCRSRRIKCDEGHPTCKQCLKSQRICMYPDTSSPKNGKDEDAEVSREKTKKKNYKEINRSVEMFTVEVPNPTRPSIDNSLRYPNSNSYPTISTATSSFNSKYNVRQQFPKMVNTNEPRYGQDENTLSPEVAGQSPQQLQYLIYQSPSSDNSYGAPRHYSPENTNVTGLTPCQHSCCSNNYAGYHLAPPDNCYTSHVSSAPIPHKQSQFTEHAHQAYFMNHSQGHYHRHWTSTKAKMRKIALWMTRRHWGALTFLPHIFSSFTLPYPISPLFYIHSFTTIS